MEVSLEAGIRVGRHPLRRLVRHPPLVNYHSAPLLYRCRRAFTYIFLGSKEKEIKKNLGYVKYNFFFCLSSLFFDDGRDSLVETMAQAVTDNVRKLGGKLRSFRIVLILYFIIKNRD